MSISNAKATQEFIEMLPNGLSFEMVKVEGGTFRMGEDDSEYDDEKPAHTVKVPDFYIGKYPVTQDLWQGIMGNNPSYFKYKNHPVETISWDDTQEFIEKLNQITGKAYRLPSEAEWEYAARGGNRSLGFRYAGGNKLKEVGWYNVNSHSETKPVGLKLPNELGICDMSGNVREWCADHWHDNYEGAPNDGSAWVTGGDSTRRVIRGGSWNNNDNNCRVSNRNSPCGIRQSRNAFGIIPQGRGTTPITGTTILGFVWPALWISHSDYSTGPGTSISRSESHR